MTITNAADVATIEPYCEITGGLGFSAAGLAAISLPNLVTVGGSVGGYAPDLVTLELPALTSIAGSFGLGPNTSLTVSLPALTSANGLFFEPSAAPLIVDLPMLSNFQGSIYVSGANGPVKITAPKITSAESVEVYSGATELVLPALADGRVTLRGNISSVDLTSYKTSAGPNPTLLPSLKLESGTACTVTLPALETATWVQIFGPIAFSAPVLETISGAGDIDPFSANSVTALDLPSLSTIGNLVTGRGLSLAGSTITTLSLPALTEAGYLDFGAGCFPTNANVNLTEISVPLLGPAGIGYLSFGLNPMLPLCRQQALAQQLGVPFAQADICGSYAAGPCP